jgi:hypothetical protein
MFFGNVFDEINGEKIGVFDYSMAITLGNGENLA